MWKLQDGHGFTAFEAEILLLPDATSNAMLSSVTGELFNKYRAKHLIIVGITFTALSIIAFIIIWFVPKHRREVNS